MIKAWDSLPPEVDTSCDAVVVGAGAGGAAAAAALAEGGLSVVVIEEGGQFAPGLFKPKAPEAFKRLYVDRGNRIMAGSGIIPLPGGRGLGGSTLINSAICFRAPERIFTRWRDEFGVDGLDAAETEPLYREVEQTIAVAPTTPEIGRKHNEVFARGAAKLGLEAGWMPRNAPGCIGCAVCELGCPSGGKNSSDRTFLPRAIEKGAEVYTGCRVRRLTGSSRQITGVAGTIHDPDTREQRGTFRIRAPRVFLAAGSIATPLLLQAHGLGGSHVGRHLTVHPAGWAAGIFDEVVEFWTGVPQGYYAMLGPGAGVILETFSTVPELMAAQLPGVGADLAAWLPRMKHFAMAGGMVEDSESEGFVQAGVTGPAIRYRLARPDLAKLKRGIFEAARVYEAAGAREIVFGTSPARSAPDSAAVQGLLDTLESPEDFRIYASHPMGTCRMGPDRAKAVVDSSGRVHGVRGLYVSDASVFPTPLGVNPQMTVMLMALRVARRALRA